MRNHNDASMEVACIQRMMARSPSHDDYYGAPPFRRERSEGRNPLLS